MLSRLKITMEEIQKRLEQNGRNVTILCSPEVKNYLGNAGYSPAYGARPLARLIEKEVLNRLAVLILRGSIRDGETANEALHDGSIMVLPNHTADEVEEDQVMDEDDAVAELEDNDVDLDLYND